MDERQLTEKQKEKINEIVGMWKKEIEEIEKKFPPPDGKHFDGPQTWAMNALGKKYTPMILSVMKSQEEYF